MSDPGTVNGQIIDSTTGVVTLLTGQSPSQAFGLLDAVMVETLGMAMHNAIGRQQGASVIGSAAVTAACAKMLSVPLPIAPPPAPKPPPPAVDPLPGPPPNPSPSAAVAAAFAEAESAVTALKLQASSASSLAQTAQADLNQIVTDAGGTTPSTPPNPSSSIATAYADAASAIDTLKAQAATANGLAQTAESDLNKLITEAGGTPPAPPKT
ncbi:RebB family R body protein [Bradyrhizobium sp. HKCCYLS3013]|uniref:RebB family R body protein n=1 Tax=Bradyrhizobium sp. HKCCYLS3013 TaxID=3420735 RepID=UPI003EBB8EFE